MICLKFVCVQPEHFRRFLYVSESYASSRWPEVPVIMADWTNVPYTNMLHKDNSVGSFPFSDTEQNPIAFFVLLSQSTDTTQYCLRWLQPCNNS